jgi:hypothetical protein
MNWRLWITVAALLSLAMTTASGWSQMEGMEHYMAMQGSPRPRPGPIARDEAPTDPCPGGILPRGNSEAPLDLMVNKTCTVDGTQTVKDAKGPGVYVYQNVNVVNGGTLVFSDAMIDFHAHSILVERGGTLKAGAESPITKRVTI